MTFGLAAKVLISQDYKYIRAELFNGDRYLSTIREPSGYEKGKEDISRAKNPKVVGSYLGAGKVIPIKIYFY